MPLLESLVTAAVQAPSGDNTQPWRFAIDSARRRLTIDLDPARDLSPMNAGQRMARIAVGAALENVLRTLAKNGHPAEWSIDPATGAASVEYPQREEPLVRDETIFLRTTNRRPYDGRPIDPDVQTRLTQQAASPFAQCANLPSPPGRGEQQTGAGPPGNSAAFGRARNSISIHWIFDRNRLPGLAELIAQADAALFAMRDMRLALRANVRFEAGYRADVTEGLSLPSLEIPRLAAGGFRFLLGVSDGWFRRLGGSGSFSRLARKLVASASGLCLVIAADTTPETDVLVGLALQRAWLALTDSGLSAQPMMTLPCLENVLQHGTPEQRSRLDGRLIEKLQARFHELVPEARGERPAFLLRFGFAGPVSGRTGRLPWRQLCTPAPTAPQTGREASVRV